MTFKDTDFYDVLFIPAKFLVMIYRSKALSIKLQSSSDSVFVAFGSFCLYFLCTQLCPRIGSRDPEMQTSSVTILEVLNE